MVAVCWELLLKGTLAIFLEFVKSDGWQFVL